MSGTKRTPRQANEKPWRIARRVSFPVRCSVEIEAGRSDVAVALCRAVWGAEARNIRFLNHSPVLLAVAKENGFRLEVAGDSLAGLGLSRSRNGVSGADEVVVGATAVLRLAKAWADEIQTGSEERAALEAMLDAWKLSLAEEQRACLDVLGRPPLDTGGLLRTFLRGVHDEAARERLAESEGHWKQRWITWLLGQMRIDLPYDRHAVRDTLATVTDPDELRALLYRDVRAYDREAEKANAARIASEVAWAEEELIFGRMSRAFHNQALLFAHSRYVSVSEAMAERGAALVAAVSGWPALKPAAERVALLLVVGRETPLTELTGAIDHVEDAAVQQQRVRVQAVLEKERRESGSPSKGKGNRDTVSAEFNATKSVLAATKALRREVDNAVRRPAAYVVISQRPSPTGSHLLAKINEGQDPFLGKPEELRQLVRQAGDRVYASPDYAWLEYANHWIEAIPLFIKERIRVVDGVESAETVIDQEGMEESFREQMADHWNRNLTRSELSGLSALARAAILDPDPMQSDLSITADLPRAWRVKQHGPAESVARLTAALAMAAEEDAYAISAFAEMNGDRLEATRSVLFGNDAKSGIWRAVLLRRKEGADWSAALDESLAEASGADRARFDALLGQAEPLAAVPRRPLPVLHVLTTQSARMTDGYIRSWLEESMALARVIEACGLEDEVRRRMEAYSKEIDTIADALVRELGLETEIESIMAAERVSRRAAIRRIIGANRLFQKQVSLLAVLREVSGVAKGDAGSAIDPPELVGSAGDAAEDIARRALAEVVNRNGGEIARRVAEALAASPGRDPQSVEREVVLADADLRADLEAFTRFENRERLFQEWTAKHPEWRLQERRGAWLRKHQRLPLTTARKEIIAERGLNHLTLDPRFFVQATGGNKRYHLIYTPSRVDLGPKERESVETWAQWVGGRDRQAAQVGRRVYGLINKSVKRFDSLSEPEVLKTGENAAMATHFAYSNAMALMVNATGRGDMEDLGDQMSLRNDRIIHPAGEGYGGYCVPKDGLFLEFVLTLSERVKLRQLGIDERFHAAVADLARTVLLKREDFPSGIEWERWAEGLLAQEGALKGIFGVRPAPGSEETTHIPVFQITRIASVLEQLGQPPLHDRAAVVKGLAARWGIHTMVAGAEHVNRFMPFYKAWTICDGLAAARKTNPAVAAIEDSVIVLSAEYKPDTQDGRFSVGMRKFEILAGTGDHLRFSLGKEAATLASLMFDGWADVESKRGQGDPALEQLAARWADGPGDAREALKAVFPGFGPPAELRLVSPMGLSTQDVLRYTSDTRLEEHADEARSALLGAGLSEDDIRAHLAAFGPRLEQWTKLRNRTDADALSERLRGKIHALSLAVLGPERSYEHALQGADVFDVGIPHRQVMELLAQPARVCDLMLFGRPGSALLIVDGASGARRRALTRRGVMLWFAAAENRGREAGYRAIGLGEETVEEWRRQMREERERARGYADAVKRGRTDALNAFSRIVTQLQEEREASLVLEEEERLQRFSRDTERDHAAARLLTKVSGMRDPAELTFAHWLALGGMFLMEGCSPAIFEKELAEFERARGELSGTSATGPGVNDVRELARTLVRPLERAYGDGFRQVGGVESSNKATEESGAIALSTRRQLAERARRLKSLQARGDAFTATWRAVTKENPGAEEQVTLVRRVLGDAGQFASDSMLGEAIARTRAFGELLAEDLFPPHSPELVDSLAAIALLLNEREFDPSALKGVCGGYEDIGVIGRLAQTVSEGAFAENWKPEEKNAKLDLVASFAEFVNIIHAIEITLADKQRSADEVDAPALWRRLASYFAETLNDHFYEYRPWAYSRGVGFQEYSGDRLYALANRHFAWLYAYLRDVIATRTEIRYLTPVQQDLLLGRVDGSVVIAAIGATGETDAERRWRAFNQLREIAFIRNDGFPLPPTFDGFDPDLIDAENRANILSMHPVGRTHVSRLLAEGPALARELVVAGQAAANVIVSRCARVEGDRVLFDDGHLYVDKQTYVQALRQNWGLSEPGAAALADRDVGPKGVRIAVRFSRPVRAAVVLPMHGNPVYDGGHLERLGLPYSVQSRFHTWTTYDKAKYPEIFAGDTGVSLPAEIDWLSAWTSLFDEVEARTQIRSGRPGTTYCGLEEFSASHRIVMVKDAAESGGRGQKAFVLRDPSGKLNESAMEEAVGFLYQISLVHNVAVQEVVISSPEAWATEAFLQRFVDRQLTEWFRPIVRDRQPPTPLFGSFRVIVSTDKPLAPDRYHHWHMSHRISLNSTQLITNVGRGGTLDLLCPEDIQPEHRDAILGALDEAARRTMEAMAAFENRAGARYTAETGLPVGKDASGVSYGIPRYLMLDFLVRPVFDRKGEVVETVPKMDEEGKRVGSVFVLQDGSELTEGRIADWEVVLIEPNIGIGLWDRVAIREEEMERNRAKRIGQRMNWDRVGENARVVLRDLTRAGIEYLEATRRKA